MLALKIALSIPMFVFAVIALWTFAVAATSPLRQEVDFQRWLICLLLGPAGALSLYIGLWMVGAV